MKLNDYLHHASDPSWIAAKMCMECGASKEWAIGFIEECVEAGTGMPAYSAYILATKSIVPLEWATHIIEKCIINGLDGSYMAGALLTLDYPDKQQWLEQAVLKSKLVDKTTEAIDKVDTESNHKVF